MIETENAARETERSTNKWKQQQPVITVVTTLALGLRKMRAELRRRLEACKELATLACHNPLATTAEPTRQIEN